MKLQVEMTVLGKNRIMIFGGTAAGQRGFPKLL
jgi:hypothetical protein